MKHCENCGAELREGMKFCGDCGSPVPMEKTEEHSRPTESSERELLIQESKEIQAEVNSMGSIGQGSMEPHTGKTKKVIIATAIIVTLLSALAVGALWQAGIFSGTSNNAALENGESTEDNDEGNQYDEDYNDSDSEIPDEGQVNDLLVAEKEIPDYDPIPEAIKDGVGPFDQHSFHTESNIIDRNINKNSEEISYFILFITDDEFEAQCVLNYSDSQTVTYKRFPGDSSDDNEYTFYGYTSDGYLVTYTIKDNPVDDTVIMTEEIWDENSELLRSVDFYSSSSNLYCYYMEGKTELEI